MGDIPPSGTLPSSVSPAPLPLSELWAAAPGNNASMIQRASSSFQTDDEAARALRAQTAAEVSSGKAEWTTLPPTLCDVVLSPRFGVDQGWKEKGDR